MRIYNIYCTTNVRLGPIMHHAQMSLIFLWHAQQCSSPLHHSGIRGGLSNGCPFHQPSWRKRRKWHGCLCWGARVTARHGCFSCIVVDLIAVNVLTHLHFVVIIGKNVRHILCIAEPDNCIRRHHWRCRRSSRRLHQRVVVAVIREPFLVRTCVPATEVPIIHCGRMRFSGRREKREEWLIWMYAKLYIAIYRTSGRQ